jgi:hypothetical protein
MRGSKPAGGANIYFPRAILLEYDFDGCSDNAVLPADRCPLRIAVTCHSAPLADEALWRWFPRLQAYLGVVGVMGADAVSVMVPEPTCRKMRGSHTRLHGPL